MKYVILVLFLIVTTLILFSIHTPFPIFAIVILAFTYLSYWVVVNDFSYSYYKFLRWVRRKIHRKGFQFDQTKKYDNIIKETPYKYPYKKFLGFTIENWFGEDYNLVYKWFFNNCWIEDSYKGSAFRVRYKKLDFLISMYDDYKDSKGKIIVLFTKEDLDYDNIKFLEDNLIKEGFLDAIREVSKTRKERENNKQNIKQSKYRKKIEKNFV